MGTSDKTSLGDRMKMYEGAFKASLPARMPVVLRIDGKAFHTYTHGCQKPFDAQLISAMDNVAKALCEQIQGAQIAYVQSDEISVLIHGYKKFESSSWFDNQIQKMVSVAASIAAGQMTALSPTIFNGQVKIAAFDARAFILPEAEVCNYFLWRQQDATRNSIQMLARSLYSHKELDNKNGSQLQEMCFLKGKNWNSVPTYQKRGRCIVKENYTVADSDAVRSRWSVDDEIPVFSENRDYINQHLKVLEE
jgi:tRNA(His) 5'-end guanylyltransferase